MNTTATGSSLTDRIIQAGRISGALRFGGEEAQRAMTRGVADIRKHVRNRLEDRAFEAAYELTPPCGYTKEEWGRLNVAAFLEAAAKATEILFPASEG